MGPKLILFFVDISIFVTLSALPKPKNPWLDSDNKKPATQQSSSAELYPNNPWLSKVSTTPSPEQRPSSRKYPEWASRLTSTTTATEKYTPIKVTDILPTYCGVSGNALGTKIRSKIVNGEPTPIEMNPWQVALVRASSKQLQCGGSIISKKHVITAFHCFRLEKKQYAEDGSHVVKEERVPKENVIIYAGNEDINEVEDIYKISEIFLHLRYDRSHRRNDIALILIVGEFEWSTRIFPICLPSPKAAYKSNLPCRVSGWGRKAAGSYSTEDHLQSAVINIVKPRTCKQRFAGHGQLSKGMFCAAGHNENGTTDTCQGDSGGPFTCDDSDRATLYGITSWGIDCGNEEFPGVYVKVAEYVDWIHNLLVVSMGGRSRSTLDDDEDIDESLEDDDDDEE